MPDVNLPQLEWFERPEAIEGGQGLRFTCTTCGNCCSGPEGFVLVSDSEAAALAGHLGISLEAFLAQYTTIKPEGRSLIERFSERTGHDCVFLDRQTIPGKAICGVYAHRPAQCRTWPFWKSNLRSEWSWARAKAICPGMNTGQLHEPAFIKQQREVINL
jgi:hypothetical protein